MCGLFTNDHKQKHLKYEPVITFSNATVLSMRMTIEILDIASGPPPKWNCSASLWNNHECNCNCGIEDPECSDPDIGPFSPDCASTDMCSGSRCIRNGYATKCDLKKRGTDGICDCGCGNSATSADPDCGFPRNSQTCGEHSPGFTCNAGRSDCTNRLLLLLFSFSSSFTMSLVDHCVFVDVFQPNGIVRMHPTMIPFAIVQSVARLMIRLAMIRIILQIVLVIMSVITIHVHIQKGGHALHTLTIPEVCAIVIAESLTPLVTM